MNHAGDQFFAGAGLAFDQHGGVGGRHAREGLIDLDHARRAADHFCIGQIVDGGGLVLVLRGVQRFFGAADGLDHVRHFEGLGQIFECPAFGGRHHGFHAAAAGHQDHGAQWILFAGGVEDVDAGALVQINIGNDDGVGLGRRAARWLRAWRLRLRAGSPPVPARSPWCSEPTGHPRRSIVSATLLLTTAAL